MKAVRFLGDRRLEIVEVPNPTPGPNDVVIKVMASGMCGSDLSYYRQPASEVKNPVIAGHEPCGVVVEVGSNVSQYQAHIGDRVMIFHYEGCGACIPCQSGWDQMCTTFPAVVLGKNGDGSHANYMKVPAVSLVPLPEEVSFVAGAAISCGTGTAWQGLQRLGLQGGHTVAIFGQGPVGLSGTQLATAMGARVIALDINDDRLAMAKTFGAYATINTAAEKDVIGAIQELTHGLGAHRAMDCTTSPTARQQACQSVRQWGQVCYVGWNGTVTLDVPNDLLLRQVTLMGSWTFSKAAQYECARFVADRGIDVDALFTDRWLLEQADEAYKDFDKQTGGKGVILPNG